MKLRKEVLGLDSYHLYDGFAPLVDYEQAYDYNEITKLITESVEPLGKDYQAKMKELFGGRRIDVFENEGKSTGAYSAGVYGVHPYILLNFDETLEEVFTVAHEAGHALHSMLSMENQPYATSDYTTFVAEVASTMDENLFLDYMLKHSDDPYERVALLQQALDNISGTFYKQTFFADFEHQAHQMVEQGQPITGDALRSLYATLLEEYYGDALVVDDIYLSYWTRISHFFGIPFYVFKYATSYSASSQLAEGIKSDDKKTREEAVEKYLSLLKSGGNDYPMEQLKNAGVDMSKPETYEAVIKHLDRLVDQLEKELKDLNLIVM
jgi:oligoendopeptidase F